MERGALDDPLLRTLTARLRELGDEEAAELLAALVGTLSVDAAGAVMERLAPHATLDYGPHAIRLLVSSAEIGVRLVSVEKEPFTVEWIERSFTSGQVFYDIGANVGAYSLIAAKVAPSGARVIAFEPSPASFLDLSRNVALNDCSHIVTPLPLALWSRDELLALAPGTTVSGSESRPEVAGAAEHDVTQQAQSAPGSVPIVGIRLDDLVERFGLPVPSHAKIDTDGYELEVLAGAERTLARSEWESIHVELDREETGRNEQIRRVLADAGFRNQRRHERRPTSTFPDPESRPDVYWTFSRDASRRNVPRGRRPVSALRAVRTSPVRAAQRRAVTATLALVTFLFLLLVLLPEELGDRPYDVFGLKF